MLSAHVPDCELECTCGKYQGSSGKARVVVRSAHRPMNIISRGRHAPASACSSPLMRSASGGRRLRWRRRRRHTAKRTLWTKTAARNVEFLKLWVLRGRARGRDEAATGASVDVACAGVDAAALQLLRRFRAEARETVMVESSRVVAAGLDALRNAHSAKTYVTSA